jgi:hypothetical protein
MGDNALAIKRRARKLWKPCCIFLRRRVGKRGRGRLRKAVAPALCRPRVGRKAQARPPAAPSKAMRRTFFGGWPGVFGRCWAELPQAGGEGEARVRVHAAWPRRMYVKRLKGWGLYVQLRKAWLKLLKGSRRIKGPLSREEWAVVFLAAWLVAGLEERVAGSRLALLRPLAGSSTLLVLGFWCYSSGLPGKPPPLNARCDERRAGCEKGPLAASRATAPALPLAPPGKFPGRGVGSGGGGDGFSGLWGRGGRLRLGGSPRPRGRPGPGLEGLPWRGACDPFRGEGVCTAPPVF